jgi:hypothetical protein
MAKENPSKKEYCDSKVKMLQEKAKATLKKMEDYS